MNSCDPSAVTSSTSSSTRSGGRTQRSTVRKPMRSRGCIAWVAFSKSCLHCLPQVPSGLMLCSAPSISARKARPRTSILASSGLDSSASPVGATRKTWHCPVTSGTSSCSLSRNSATVALTAQKTVASPSGRWAFTARCRWLGGVGPSCKIDAAGVVGLLPSKYLKCGASSMTSRLEASSSSTPRKGIAFEVFPPCWMWRQMPKSSWKRDTHEAPRRNCNWVMKLKSSPRLMS
mmetsp:Transcript_139037/g.432558  ORF Transcript_139037/g.432558 Transcript_139037/m.432558 type:complete len:233 (+) Transcript_139037:832-1530(+)